MPTMSAKWRHTYKATTKGRSKVLISNAKQRCKEKNVQISITAEWVEEHLKRGTCGLTGISFDFGPPTKGLTRLPNAPSLDRIDKNKHYTEDNTRVILWAVNCALAEYGTEIMLPILKATVKGIEDADKKSTTPVSTGADQQSSPDAKRRAPITTGSGQDDNDTYHHCGTVRREDINHSAQASGGVSVGPRSYEVESPITLTRIENNGEPDAEIIRLDFGRGHLSD